MQLIILKSNKPALRTAATGYNYDRSERIRVAQPLGGLTCQTVASYKYLFPFFGSQWSFAGGELWAGRGGGAFCVGFGAWMIRRADAEAEAGHQLPYLNMQFQFPKNTIPACNTQLTRPSCLPLDGKEKGVVRDGRRIQGSWQTANATAGRRITIGNG